MADQRIVVVGSGIAGLTAAYLLEQEGHHPIVLEKSNRVGGRMISDVVDGFTIDCGAQFLSDRYPILTSFIDRLGMRSGFLETSQYTGTVRKRRIRKFCNGDVLSPLKSGLLSIPAWLRFGLRSYGPFARIRSLPVDDFSAWADHDDVDAETWSMSCFGREITDYVMEPLTNALFYQALGETSRALVMGMAAFFFRERAKYAALAGGIGALPERLASELDVRLDTPVRSISIGKNGVELDLGTSSLTADAAILATTASAARALYPDAGPVERELVSTRYSSTCNVAIAVKDAFRVDSRFEDVYAILVPKTERRVLSGITIEANKDVRRLGEGKLFCAFLSGTAGAEMIGWSDDDVVSAVLREMDEYFAGISRNVLFTKVYRWKEAMPMFAPGRSRAVARYRSGIGPSARIVLAGDYTGLPYTEGAAETGAWAARTLLRNIGSAPSR